MAHSGAFLSTNNSTTTALADAAAFVGTEDDVTGYSSVTVFVVADQTGILKLQRSTQGSGGTNTWHTYRQTTIAANGFDGEIDAHLTATVDARYFRVRVENSSGSAQTVLEVQTVYHRNRAALANDGVVISGTASVDVKTTVNDVRSITAMSRDLGNTADNHSTTGTSGYLRKLYASNSNASLTRFVKVYNQQDATAVGSTPVLVFPVVAQTSINLELNYGFSSGFSLRAATSVANTDAADVAGSEDVIVIVTYEVSV